MSTPNDIEARTVRLNPWVLLGILVAEVSLSIWGGSSVIVFALALHAPKYLAWIPAVALGGVMLSATMFAILPGMDREIRRYAGYLACAAIGGEVIVAGAQHYFEAKAPIGQAVEAIHVDPLWGFIVGGLPSLMGGALVHLTAMYFAMLRRKEEEAGAAKEQKEQERQRELDADAAQRRRDAADLAEVNRDLTTIRGARAALRDEQAALNKERREARQKELDDAAAHRQKLHDEAVADVERLQQELVAVEVEAATRAQQGLRQECNKVAELQVELNEALRVAEETKAATADALAEAEEHRAAAAQKLDEARADHEDAKEEDREAERLRSKAKRTRQRLEEATSSQPSSQSVSQRHATSSQAPSQTATRDVRREWARQQIESGDWAREHDRDLAGADIDKKFGPPRTGAAILREVQASFEGELRVIASGGA